MSPPLCGGDWRSALTWPPPLASLSPKRPRQERRDSGVSAAVWGGGTIPRHLWAHTGGEEGMGVTALAGLPRWRPSRCPYPPPTHKDLGIGAPDGRRPCSHPIGCPHLRADIRSGKGSVRRAGGVLAGVP